MNKVLKIFWIPVLFLASCGDIQTRITFNSIAIISVALFGLAIAFYFFHIRKKWFIEGYFSTALRSHALDYLPSAIAITDEKHRIIVWNHRAEEIFKWKETELIGIHMDKMVPKDQCPIFECELNRILEGEHPRYFEISLMRRNGKVFDGEMKINIHREHSANHFLFVMRDITERKTRELDMREDMSLFKEGEILSGFGSWQWDLIKDEVLLSPGFQQIFHVYQRKVPANILMRLVHVKDRDRIGRILTEAISNNQAYEAEYTLVTPDQQIVPIYIKAKPVIEANNGKAIKCYNGIIKIKETNNARNE